MDRIERHDVVNAVGLSVALLVMALGLVFGARTLFDTVNGVVSAEKEPETAADSTTTTVADSTPVTNADGSIIEGTGDPAVTDDTTPDDTTTTTVPLVVRPPAEVTVRVGNGARKPGVAGTGTDILTQAGYPSLSPKNSPTVEASVVYYVEGYEGDAQQVARLMNMAPTSIAPMPADPGLPIEGAQLVVILGADTTLS